MDDRARERPLLMRGPLVVASLAGTKTQTRRLVSPPPDYLGGRGQEADPACWGWGDEVGAWVTLDTSLPPYHGPKYARGHECYAAACPYGRPGDRLWVREMWQTGIALDDEAPALLATWARAGGYEPCGPLRYVADGATRDEHLLSPGSHYGAAWGRKRPGIHMPRWACRLVLQVEGVRVERVRDISEDDAKAEGVTTRGRTLGDQVRHGFTAPAADHRTVFRDLWDSINAQRPGASWEANPWVWVISYRKAQP